jgi:hypothetical protein
MRGPGPGGGRLPKVLSTVPAPETCGRSSAETGEVQLRPRPLYGCHLAGKGEEDQGMTSGGENREEGVVGASPAKHNKRGTERGRFGPDGADFRAGQEGDRRLPRPPSADRRPEGRPRPGPPHFTAANGIRHAARSGVSPQQPDAGTGRNWTRRTATICASCPCSPRSAARHPIAPPCLNSLLTMITVSNYSENFYLNSMRRPWCGPRPCSSSRPTSSCMPSASVNDW